MLESLTIGAVQLTSTDDLAANLATCRRLAAAAADAGARVIVLPECFAFLGRREGDKMAVAEVVDEARPGPILACLQEIAGAHRAIVIGGGLPEAVPGERDRAFNTALAVDPGGAVVAAYRKIHLFDVDIPGGAVARESDATVAGAGAVLLRVDGFGLGLSICYDLRFPELYRQLWRAGADALLVPAAFTAHTGRAHWHTLLRARAIENQCYVVAAAQHGRHNDKRETFGHSLAIDPWGRVIGEHAEGEGVVVATLDRALLAETRRNMPCALHAVTIAAPAPVAIVDAALPA
jgi:predicted amidohydrolase